MKESMFSLAFVVSLILGCQSRDDDGTMQEVRRTDSVKENTTAIDGGARPSPKDHTETSLLGMWRFPGEEDRVVVTEFLAYRGYYWFKEDGRFEGAIVSGKVLPFDGKYRIEGDRLILSRSDGGENVWAVQLTENVLLVTDLDDDDPKPVRTMQTLIVDDEDIEKHIEDDHPGQWRFVRITNREWPLRDHRARVIEELKNWDENRAGSVLRGMWRYPFHLEDAIESEDGLDISFLWFKDDNQVEWAFSRLKSPTVVSDGCLMEGTYKIQGNQVTTQYQWPHHTPEVLTFELKNSGGSLVLTSPNDPDDEDNEFDPNSFARIKKTEWPIPEKRKNVIFE